MIQIHHRTIQAASLNEPSLQDSESQMILLAMEQSHEHFSFPNQDQLRFEVKMRKNIVQQALNLSQTDVAFATFYYSKCNDQYWDLTNEGGFQLKTGVNPSDAILDIYRHSRQYAFECATAMMIIMYRAAIESFGKEIFDSLFSHLYLWDWNKHRHFPMISAYTGEDLIPGDVCYFKNPDVSSKTPQWQGENAIVLYEDWFYGHGVGIQNQDGIIEILNQRRKSHATRSAYLMKRATRPKFDTLYLLNHRKSRISDEIVLHVGHMEYPL